MTASFCVNSLKLTKDCDKSVSPTTHHFIQELNKLFYYSRVYFILTSVALFILLIKKRWAFCQNLKTVIHKWYYFYFGV